MLISLILTICSGFLLLGLGLVLLRRAWRARDPLVGTTRRTEAESRKPENTSNDWLRAARTLFLLSAVILVAFHSYWVFWADRGKDSRLAKAKALDARNRRFAESGLKGWILDRTGKLENALVRYRYDGRSLVREYPLGRAAVHLTGFSDYVYGAGGIEAAYQDWLTEPVSTFNRLNSPVPVGKDLQVSIDSELQREAFKQIEATGKPAAAVVLLLPSNEVLAMASTPSFEPSSIQDEETWRRLTEQADDPSTQPLSPLVNRVLGTLVTGGPAFYYRPGSTFKTFVAAVAVDTGLTGERFTCRGDGFTPPGARRSIRDYGGEVHGTLGLHDAFRLSCNQYFAQLGLKLGKRKLAEYAQRLGYSIDPDDAPSRQTGIWQVSQGNRDRVDFLFAVPKARMNLEPAATAFDVALQSFGQGFDDFTVMSMALLASAAASVDGAIAAPTLELNLQRKPVSGFISPRAAAELRTMMRSVVERGTAAGVFNSRFVAAGKTGTADRDALAYDSEGQPVVDRDSEGKTHLRFRGLTDSWFIGFAPADKPQVVFAVMVENGGQGAKSAAPIGERILEKCSALGYLTAANSLQQLASGKTR